MRKLTIILLAVFIGTMAYSQDTATCKGHNHEIGLDATPLLQQFFFLNIDQNYPVINPYHIMYRYHMNQWAIRGGIGGYYWTDEYKPDETTLFNRKQSLLQFRLGMEHKIEMGRRWQCFYGLDLLTNTNHDHDDYQYSNGSQIVGCYKMISYGVAPILGFRFKISDRISLTTESSYQFLRYNIVDKQLYTPDSSQSSESTEKGMETYFQTPKSLFFTFNF